MDSNLYLQILKNELLNSLKHYGFNPANITFRQNNNPKNTFKNVKKWLGEQEFRTMVCPEQSSDLSPLKIFEKKLAKHENPLIEFMSCGKDFRWIGRR